MLFEINRGFKEDVAFVKELEDNDDGPGGLDNEHNAGTSPAGPPSPLAKARRQGEPRKADRGDHTGVGEGGELPGEPAAGTKVSRRRRGWRGWGALRGRRW